MNNTSTKSNQDALDRIINYFNSASTGIRLIKSRPMLELSQAKDSSADFILDNTLEFPKLIDISNEMNNTTLIEVCIWPDNTWCEKCELWQYSDTSDDFVVESLNEQEYNDLLDGVAGYDEYYYKGDE